MTSKVSQDRTSHSILREAGPVGSEGVLAGLADQDLGGGAGELRLHNQN